VASVHPIDVPAHLGYPLLALLVGVESMGFPVPGETALLAAAVLAHGGTLEIVPVVVVAAAAAIVGDNLGYLIGRHGGRRLFTRPGPLYERRMRLVAQGERLVARHGAKAVFLGRWFAGLRITAAWLAGAHRMRWSSFVLWNALGGVLWAAGVGALGYLLGEAAGRLLAGVGLAALALLVLAAGVLVWLRRRAERSATGANPVEPGAADQNTGDSV
jgi:membrane protein DedA with SNARE-associated domain